jgi:hypothetical protein
MCWHVQQLQQRLQKRRQRQLTAIRIAFTASTRDCTTN